MKKTITALTIAGLTCAANAATLAINFTGSLGDQPTATAFGVDAGDWNNIGGSNGTNVALTADNGDAAQLTFHAGGVWRITNTAQTPGDNQVLNGYLDDHSGGPSVNPSFSIDMSALTTGTYTVTVYSSSGSAPAAMDFQPITVNGSAMNPVDSAHLTGSTATTVFTNVSGNFTMSSLGRNTAPNPDLRGTISGFKIDYVAVPEPSSAALLGLGGLTVLLRRRRKN